MAEVNHGVTRRKRGNCCKTASSWLTVIREAMTVRTIQTGKRFTALDLFRKAVGASRGRRSTPLKHGPYILRWSPASGTDTFGRVGFLKQGVMRYYAASSPRTGGDTELAVVAEFQIQDVQQDKTA
jgi:hypothetical protein